MLQHYECIEKGKRNVEILKQAQNDPFQLKIRLPSFMLVLKDLLRKVPVEKVKEFEKDYLEFMNAKHRDVLEH